jgi:opacity protein-like surface antigen
VRIKTALCLAPFLGAVLVSQAMAQSPVSKRSPWYFGFGVSLNDATIPSDSLVALTPPGATVGDIDDRFSGFQAYLGYAFSRYLAVEAGGGVIGSTSAAYSDGQIVKWDMSTFFIDAVGALPFAENWALIGRVGATVGETRLKFTNSTIVVTADQRDESEIDLKFGGGLQYSFTPDIGSRVEYARYKMPDPVGTDSVKVDSFTASVFFRF